MTWIKAAAACSREDGHASPLGRLASIGAFMTAIDTAIPARRAPIYADDVTRAFIIATIFWGVVAFAAGVYIAQIGRAHV